MTRIYVRRYDLEGVFVNNTSTDCDITNSNFPDQCLKCADLAIFQGGNGPQVDASSNMIGNTTDNIFTVCDADNPISAFNALITVGGSAEGDIEDAFEECVLNANASSPSLAQIASLQDNSLTTTVNLNQKYPHSMHSRKTQT